MAGFEIAAIAGWLERRVEKIRLGAEFVRLGRSLLSLGHSREPLKETIQEPLFSGICWA
ncbi:hypothetical protein ACFVKH_09265 [Almyronema epifaneia S1]|uniref:Uncharacterized protein n=1 Tax=Almyronema epifaneia S1 TaxID=2991925 RepID=A0ABW6IGG8_9CYAN